jgi:hypothetical protein
MSAGLLPRLGHRIGRVAVAVVVALTAIGVAASAPVPRAAASGAGGDRSLAQDPPAGDLATAITSLGAFDLNVRSAAARTIRRTPADRAVPALTQAAQGHADSYVRYRALVLLSSFGHASTAETMRALLADKDDRVRTVASAWFEHHPDPAALPALIESLGRERSEYVRPALTRAIAAHGADPRARDVLLPLVTRGEDVYRGAVIDALGDYKAAYALKDISAVAVLDGPLQDDAITAIGRIADRSGLTVLSTLQQSGPASVKPAIAALERVKSRDAAIELLRDSFDLLSQEDYEQERFFVAVRNAIGAAPAGSPRRAVAEAIARKLEI